MEAEQYVNASKKKLNRERMKLEAYKTDMQNMKDLEPNITSLEKGALGIDFNLASIDWAVINLHSNLKRYGSIKINVLSKRSNQTEDIIGKACAELVRQQALVGN